MSNRSLRRTVLGGVLVLFVLSGCLGVPNVPTDEVDRTTRTTDHTPTTEDCPTVVQTEEISSEEAEQAEESVIPFEELSATQQELFRHAHASDSYEVRDVPETVVMEIANGIIRYENSTYRFHVIVC